MVTRAAKVDGIAAAFAPDNDQWRKDGSAIVAVIPTDETVDSGKAHVVTQVSDAIQGVPGVVGIAGVGPTVLDYINAVYKKFPYSLGLIALVTFGQHAAQQGPFSTATIDSAKRLLPGRWPP